MGKRPEAFTVNEWREVAGLKPRQDGDVYLRQADHWEAVDASDIISVTPIRSGYAPTPPSSLKGLPQIALCCVLSSKTPPQILS